MLSWKCYRRDSRLTISLTHFRERQFPETLNLLTNEQAEKWLQQIAPRIVGFRG
jgi:exonuclease I